MTDLNQGDDVRTTREIVSVELRVTYDDGTEARYGVAQGTEIVREPDVEGWGFGFDDPERFMPRSVTWFTFRVPAFTVCKNDVALSDVTRGPRG